MMIASLIQDVRYSLRQLTKTPGFTVTAVLTLALGIGANAAIFTLVNAVLLKDLPVADPRTLLRLGNNDECCVNTGIQDDGSYALFSTDTYLQLKKSAPEFQELAAMQAGFSFRPITSRRDGDQGGAHSVVGEFVSGNYFRTFGLRPQAGRLLTDADDAAGAPMTAVMSYETWQRDYASDPSVVDSIFWINTKAVTIAGIAPKGFYGDRLSSAPPDFYMPIESIPELSSAPFLHQPERRWLYLVGRVKPGVAMAPLQEKLSALIRQAFALNKDFSTEQGKVKLAKTHVVLTPGGAGIQEMQDTYASNLKLLMIISGLVLLIACANIANLLLVRGMARRAEMSVRTALGAMRGRIVRQLLTESIVLAAMSGIAGLAIAYAGTRMLLMLAFPDSQSVPIDANPSGAVLGFACGLSLLTGIVFGVAPAWITAQANPADALRTGTRTTTSDASFVQRALVVLQTALSLVLLVGAGLFSQSLSKLQHVDMKLDAKNRYIVHINPQAAGYSQTQLEAFYRTIEERFHAIPGVTKVGISSYTPMEHNSWSTSVQVEGQPDLNLDASIVRGSAEYFDSVGTHVLMGRGIGIQDTPAAPPVAVVNQAFAKKLFKPGENPIGRRFGSPGPDTSKSFEIVGVVEDTAYTDARSTNHRMAFLSLLQRPESDKESIEKDESLFSPVIVLQTERPRNDMESLTRKTLSAINPNLTVVKFQTFDQQIADQFTEERMVARLMMLFGALALLLATLGLYGVTAYTVARRTSEIGIRMALGAGRAGVVGMVMRGAMLQAGIGLAIGIPVALLCVRFIKSQLYDVNSRDLSVMAAAIVVLAASACIAGLIPARRAASTDPIKALRME
jgi:macrolide transport system ATP-binding/permease protein